MDENLVALTQIATDVKEGASAFTKGLADNRSALEKVVADFREAIPKPKAEEKDDKAKGGTADVEEARALSGFTEMEVFGLPVGKALIGGASAVAVGELVDMLMARFMPNGGTWVSALGKGAAAWLATSRWVTNIIGKPAGTVAAVLLTYDAIRDIVPFDTWIRNAIPGHRVGEFGGRAMTGDVIKQAEKVASGYYPSISGRVG